MKKLLLILIGLWIAAGTVLAQGTEYSNVVLGPDGEPIMGATVEVTGSGIKTVTDMDGKFTISIPEGYTTLTVSYGGMKKQLVNTSLKPVVLYRKGVQPQQTTTPVTTVIPKRQQKITAYETPAEESAVQRDYKRNIFNLEFSYTDVNFKWEEDDYSEDYNEDCLNISLGYHHFFSKYFAWEVFNLGYLIRPDADNFEDMFGFGIARLTTGLKLNSPCFYKNMSVWADVRAGGAFSVDDNEFGSTYGIGVGINLSRTIYFTAKYDWAKYEVDDDYVDADIKNKFTSFGIGFNFGK